MRTGRGRLLPVLLGLLFLLVQGTAVLHAHEGELRLQYDCELCLKAGSAADTPPANVRLPEVFASTQIVAATAADQTTTLIRSAQARAPPQTSN